MNNIGCIEFVKFKVLYKCIYLSIIFSSIYECHGYHQALDYYTHCDRKAPNMDFHDEVSQILLSLTKY